MGSATESFIGYWSQFKPIASPFVHPDDVGSSCLRDFELSLLPIPYFGDLREAEAIILMLNPGLDPEDFTWEKDPEFRSALNQNLLQSFSIDSFPNFYLHPEFQQHPGAGYWSKSRRIKGKRDPKKLQSVIHALANRDKVSLADAQAHVARKVAVVQLAPYHSHKLTRRNALATLPSAIRSRDFVHGLLCEKSKLVIAVRSASEWGFAEPLNTDHLVVYKRSLGASASLTTNSEGGRALLKKLSRVIF